MTKFAPTSLEASATYESQTVRPFRFRIPFVRSTRGLIDQGSEYPYGIARHCIPMIGQRVVLNANPNQAQERTGIDTQTTFSTDGHNRSARMMPMNRVSGFDIYGYGLTGRTREIDCEPADGFGIAITGENLEAFTVLGGQKHEPLDPQVALAVAFHALPRVFGKL